MSKITILTEDVINKIAAGEVIERPASIVKELVENSLDAGATRILVEILNSGQDMIRVTDNGEGMSKEDAQLSLIRHATSKIQNDQDLFAITTLGFRGEALASIAAVSQLSIVTKTEDALEGFNLVAEGGTIISSGIVAAERGTSIEVRNLFFNTPARKKFLKSDAVELRHIIDVVTHYALLHKEVSFKLLHENHQLLYAPAVEDMQSNIASIYGSSIAKEMLKVEYKDYLATIAGYVAKPHRARNDKTQQVIFVNGRLVHNVDLNKAVYDAF
ncbi:DNA mismatch repair endonuclease MutL, partial [Candidatus Woesearchaeota archaeon]|nr:DNA mismatch repair endonuclease MutL [Candidatus Woesearchaeota archaeon]